MRKEICLWLFCLRLWAFWAENCVFCIQSVIGNQTAHFPPGATSHVGWCDASVKAMQKNARETAFSHEERGKLQKRIKEEKRVRISGIRDAGGEDSHQGTQHWHWQYCTGTDHPDTGTDDTDNAALVLMILMLTVLMILSILHWYWLSWYWCWQYWWYWQCWHTGCRWKGSWRRFPPWDTTTQCLSDSPDLCQLDSHPKNFSLSEEQIYWKRTITYQQNISSTY